jgi:hypothetical protein
MEQADVQQLEIETKKLLDEFSKSLGSVKLTTDEEWNVEREADRRLDGEGIICSSNFRKIMLENAQNKNEDFIIAEKKKW